MTVSKQTLFLKYQMRVTCQLESLLPVRVQVRADPERRRGSF